MLLPRADCEIIEPPEGSCLWLFDAARALLDAATVGLEPFLPPEGDPECVNFRTYVSHSKPVAELYDALSIHLVNYDLTAESKRMVDRTGCGTIPLRHLARWRMELWENGYPTGSGTPPNFVPPSSADLNAVNAHLYAHGIGAFDALSIAVNSGDVVYPDTIRTGLIDTVSLSAMVPLGPLGGAAGWGWDVLMEVNG